MVRKYVGQGLRRFKDHGKCSSVRKRDLAAVDASPEDVLSGTRDLSLTLNLASRHLVESLLRIRRAYLNFAPPYLPENKA